MTSTPRITLPDPASMTARQREVYDAIVAGPRGRVVGPLRAVLLAPDLAELWQKFGQYVRYETSLPARLSELAVIVCARHWNSQLEWQVHAAVAAAAGLAPTVIDAIKGAGAPAFADADEADVYEYARTLLRDGNVGDALHARVRGRWGDVGVVELTAVVGYYTMVAMMLNSQHITTIDDAPSPLSPHPTITPLAPARPLG